MAYFNSFPRILYDLKNDGNFKVTIDFFNRLKVRSKVLKETVLYDLYDVQEGDTPESIAFKHFGDSELHWVILLTNNITDRYYDWPLSNFEFENFLNEKYTNPDGIHHYEINQSSGTTSGFSPDDYSYLIEVNSSTANAVAITNRQYEERLQDKKRQIKILDTAYLNLLIEEFENLMSS